MRPDPRRLELASYPFVAEVPTRFADLDPLHHLNNVRIGELYEDCRVRLHGHMGTDIQGGGSRTVIAQIVLNYLGEAFYPATLRVGSGILRIGGSSYGIAQGLFSDGRCIGTCDTVMVHTREGNPAPMAEGLRETLGRFLIAQ
jgi:acyl-CoA thioester hydrolase